MFTCLLIVGIIFLIRYLINKKYQSFIILNSEALHELVKINEKYIFKTVNNFDMVNKYDNEAYYYKVSPKDYLTYQLVYKRNEVENAIDFANYNLNLYQLYVSDVKSISIFGRYKSEETPKNKKKLLKMEEKLFNEYITAPITNFQIQVKIYLTNINGIFKCGKSAIFNTSSIKDILNRLEDKTGRRYNDNEIWESISIVERAKVSNKMRFAIYQRDGNRCRICGRRTNDLEIDHIIPIAKGGKTEFDNLQTLCKRCNQNKSDTVTAEDMARKYTNVRKCPKCGGSLKVVKGKYGEFYGCMNYPTCTYTQKKIKNTED